MALITCVERHDGHQPEARSGARRAGSAGGRAVGPHLRGLAIAAFLSLACSGRPGPGAPPAPVPAPPPAPDAAATGAVEPAAAARAGAGASSAKTPWVKAGNPEEVALLEAPAVVLTTPESNAGVSPPFRARVVKVHVKPGEHVRRGDPIADVVMPDVVQAAGTYAAATTRVEAYGKRAAQLESLKHEGMVRLTELLDVQTKLAEARSDQQSALAMLRVAALGPEDAQRILAGSGQVALRSPIDGVVTQVRVAIGENRDAAGEPIVRIAGEGEPRIEARAARMIPTLAHYELWLASGEKHPVKRIGTAPQVDARDGTTLVWFAPYPGTRLTQGQTGKIRIRLEEELKAVVVPARGVALAGDGAYVVRNEGGKPRKVKVEVVAASGSDALVRGALAIGDEVAADAALAIEGPAPRTTPPDFEEMAEVDAGHDQPRAAPARTPSAPAPGPARGRGGANPKSAPGGP